jgi:hypothetical protein
MLMSDLVPPAPVNRIFEHILGFEQALIRLELNLPAGGTLVVVAQRGV